VNTVERSAAVKGRATALGFAAAGVTTLGENAHAAELDRWLAAGHAGTMTYLQRQARKRKEPALIMPQARVAVVTLTNYSHGPADPAPGQGRVAQYAWSADYHDVLGAPRQAAREVGQLGCGRTPPAALDDRLDRGAHGQEGRRVPDPFARAFAAVRDARDAAIRLVRNATREGRDLRGWRYFAPGTPPDGFAVDGHMDERERAFAASGEWFVLAHGSDALLFVTRMSENLRRGVTLSLVYRDDAARPNPPEDSPGTVPLVGYRGRGIEKLPGGRYQFALHIYTLPGYRRGDERRLLAQLDAPLTAELTAEGPPPSEPAAPAAAPPAAR